MDPEPRYLGKTARQWFPIFPMGGRLAGRIPLELTTGNAESLDVLIAAMRLRDPWWLPGFYRLPPMLAAQIPRPVAAFDIQTLAGRAIVTCSREPRFAAALVTRLRELPLPLQLELDSIPEGPSKAIVDAGLLPLFELHLRNDALPVRVAMALVLLRHKGLSNDTLEQLMRIGAEALNTSTVSVSGKDTSERLLRALSDLGPVPESLTLPMRQSGADLSPGRRFELRLALTRLNPELFPAASLFATATNSLDAHSQFEAVGRLLMDASMELKPSENLGPILKEWLRFQATPDREEAVVREKVSVVTGFAFRVPPARIPTWADSFTVGLESPSQQIRHACAWALYQMKARSPAVVERVAQLLEQGREPELSLLILMEARVVPDRVQSLVHSLAAGEAVRDWTPEPRSKGEPAAPSRVNTRPESLLQIARMLLTSVSLSASQQH